MSGPEQLIQTICPSLAGSPSLPEYVGMAVGMTDQGFFGAQYAQAIALRAAHMYTLDQRTMGVGGAITGMTEGRLSIQYSANQNDSDDLSQTHYGKRLKGLMRSRPRMGVNTLYGRSL